MKDPLVWGEGGEGCRELLVGQVVEVNDEEGYLLDEDLLTGSTGRIDSRRPGAAVLVRA